MMEKLKNLHNYKSIILTLMLLPLGILIFGGNLKFEPIPESQYPQFKINFKVPGKVANEIELKVTAVAEKVFNGLPKILNLESTTKHEFSSISLTFHKGADPNNILLFIQEKLDRLKILLPSAVKQTTVDQIKNEGPPDITLFNTDLYNIDHIATSLGKIKNAIILSKPQINSKTKLLLHLDLKKMNEFNISVSQVWQALQTNGLSYRLGKKNDMSYFLDGNFKSIEEIKRIIIGAKGTKIVALKNIATLSINTPPPPSKIEIWINYDKMNLLDFFRWKDNSFKQSKYELTKINNYLLILQKPIIMLLLVLILQLLFYLIIFGLKANVLSIFSFNFVIIINFLFGVTTFLHPLNLLDIYSLILTIIIGSVFWFILLGRIRVYFLPSKLETFIQRTLLQAIYFSIIEFLPTFLTLLASLIISSIPILLSNISVPSKDIILSFIYVGIPCIIIFIIILPVFIPLGWIKKTNNKVKVSHGFLALKTFKGSEFIIIFIVIVLGYSFNKICFGINNNNTTKISAIEKAMDSYRGIGKALSFTTTIDSKDFLAVTDKEQRFEWIQSWYITPSGLRFIPNLDIQSFQMALSDISNQKDWSHLNISDTFLPLQYKNLMFDQLTFPNLLISPNNANSLPMRLGILTESKLEVTSSHIYRNQLNRLSLYSLQPKITNGFFVTTYSGIDYFEPISKNWINEMKEYLNKHILTILFIFIFLSLYFNSFYRGASVTFIAIATHALLIFYYLLTQNFIHLDSLWLTLIPFWTILFYVITLSRTADIERARGNDKKIVLNDLEMNFYNVPRKSTLFILTSMLVLGSYDYFMSQDNILITYNALVAGCLILFIYIIQNYLFRIYYISSEEFINNKQIDFVRWYYRYKRKK